MEVRSNVLSLFQHERARQDREWARVFSTLEQLDPQLTFAVQRTALEELDASFKPKLHSTAPTNALRA